MKTIQAAQITAMVQQLCLQANYHIGQDIITAMQQAKATEASPIGAQVLSQLLENYSLAAKNQLAICQDSGMAILFIKYGQEVTVANGSFTHAVNQGVRQAYQTGYLRKSVVAEPLYQRQNTGDNTPAIVHTEIVEGQQIEFLVIPKGFGSENMSALAMLTPAQGEAGVINFVLDTIKKAGPNPCPPIVVGVGLGGSMEKAAQLAKWATARPLGSTNMDSRYAALEHTLLTKINALGIGPSGTGGSTTALGVHIEHYPTHIAGLPVAVNICCHAARHACGVL